MADWSKPTLTTNYVDVLSEIDDKTKDALTQGNNGTIVNPPTNSIKFDFGTKNWKKYDGSNWVDLIDTYSININGTVNGKIAALEYDRVVTDANTVTTSGMYGIDGIAANTPSGMNYASIISVRNRDVGLQLLGGYSHDDLYFRGWSQWGDSFYTWRKIWHDGNFDPDTKANVSGSSANLFDVKSPVYDYNAVNLLSAKAKVGYSFIYGSSTTSELLISVSSGQHDGKMITMEILLPGYSVYSDKMVISWYNYANSDIPYNVKIHSLSSQCQIQVGYSSDGTKTLIHISGIGNYATPYVKVFSRNGNYSIPFTLASSAMPSDAISIVTPVRTPIDAHSLDGYARSSGVVADSIAQRDGNGDLTTRLFRSTYAVQSSAPATTAEITFRNSVSDNYLRTMTSAAFKQWLNNIGAGGIGVGQTWVDETANRAKDTTYTNSTGKPIAVYITFGGSANLSIDGLPHYNAGYFRYAIIPNGSTYKVSGYDPTLWLELK